MACYRTNLFEYNDKERIKKVCDKNNVLLSDNGNKVALFADKENIFNVCKECFDEYRYKEQDDVIYINLNMFGEN